MRTFTVRKFSTAQALKARKLAAFGLGPSLFRDHPRSIQAEVNNADRELVAQITQSWARHAAAGEYPVIVRGAGKYGAGSQSVEWRKSAVTEQVAA